MASYSRRGMDWPTAWGAMVPVYGMAVVLHAIHPLFAVPVWVIFLVYAFKVMQGARGVEDPWRGRGSPQRYFTAIVPLLIGHLAIFASLGVDRSAGTIAAAALTGVAALSSSALFVGGSAPPNVFAERRWIRIGQGSEIASALVLLVAVLGLVGSPTELAGLGFLQVGLSALSAVGFSLAQRAAKRRPPAVARKAPKA